MRKNIRKSVKKMMRVSSLSIDYILYKRKTTLLQKLTNFMSKNKKGNISLNKVRIANHNELRGNK